MVDFAPLPLPVPDQYYYPVGPMPSSTDLQLIEVKNVDP